MKCKRFVTSRILLRTLLALVAVGSSAGVCLAAPDVTLYDVDFNGPPHAAGMTPAFGAGSFPRNTPTSGGQILSPTGTAEVVSSFSPMTDQPVRLTALDGTPMDPILGGAELNFDLSDGQLSVLDQFHAQVDVLPTNVRTSTGLGVFFDAPAIHKVEFSSDGNIRVLDATGVNLIVGTHVPETIYTVRMGFDRAAGEWSASINGMPVYHGPAEDTNLTTFRIAMTTGDTTTTSLAHVDNIRITAVVPEPGALCLAGILIWAVGLLVTPRRHSG
jgi:hypothetical protein